MLRATFRQLHTFVLVAETGSFAGAADRLGVSPAAVSDQVRALERKFGYHLFDRRPGTVPVLNEKGTALLRKAPELLDTAREVESLSATASPQRVKVGSGDYILEHLFLPNLARFQLAHPETHIEFVRLSSRQDALQATSSQRMDLAYLALYARPNEPSAEFIGESSAGLFVAPSHPVLRTWNPKSDEKLPMAMPLAGSFLERMVVQMLADAGINDFDVITRAQHPDTLVDLAVAGVGVVCVMREHADQALRENRLIDLGVQLAPFYRFAFRRPNALQIEHLRQFDEFALGLLRTDGKVGGRQAAIAAS
ncbi:MAG TPA: LysR family transcriptional regulator [Alphaproteobacteria bacterium]|nr:LysR family transcriptional regulator [Alphaproteobacteria bacterium]